MSKPETRRIVGLVLKAVALGMGVVSIVLGLIPGAGDVDTQVTLFGIGLELSLRQTT